MSAEHIAEMLTLHADLHWRDAHPGMTATPAERMRAWLDHEATPCVCGHTVAQHDGPCLETRMSGGRRGMVQQCPCRTFTAWQVPDGE